MNKLFGSDNKTTIGTIFTLIGLVPQAITSLNLVEVPEWLRIFGMVCSFISFLYVGVNIKDKDKEKKWRRYY